MGRRRWTARAERDARHARAEPRGRTLLGLLLLYTALGSPRDALLVFSAVPLALTGGTATLWLRDMPLSASAAVGFIPIRGAAAAHGVMQLDSRAAAAFGARTAERLRDVADLLGLALDASGRQRAEADMLAKAHALMLREIDHRAANSLAIVAGTLALQAKVAGAAPASEGLLAAAARVTAIAAVHRHLHHADTAGGDHVDAAPLLDGFAAELAAVLFGAGRRDRLSFAAEPGAAVPLPGARASALCMIAAELATDAAKYAGTAGAVALRLAAGPGADVSISAEDRGPGFPAGFDPKASTGLGMRLLRRLTGSGEGRITIDRVQGGARITVRVAGGL